MAYIQVFECTQCKKHFAQRKWICPQCKNTDFDLKEVEGRGQVFSHTRIHISSKEFSHLTPYTVALIELSNGLRVTGRLEEEVNINEQVKCVANENNMYVFVRGR